MQTLTTIESFETVDTPKGTAYVATLLGGTKAGTFDKAIGDLAEKALASDTSVGVTLREVGGKLIIEELELIEAPPELGGPETVARAFDPAALAAELEAIAKRLRGQ